MNAAEGLAQAAVERHIFAKALELRGVSIIKWGLVAVITVIALALQLRTFPNHDVSWVLWGTREMLAGAQWGVDIIEPNPPMAWYLSMPSVWLSETLSLPIAGTFRVAVALAAVAAIVAFDWLVRLARPSSQLSSTTPTVIAALFLLVLAYRDFGQREHLMLLAAVPYLALCAIRFGGNLKIGKMPAIAIGLVAGLGFAQKPYFLAAPLLVELMGIAITRRWLNVLRPETWAMGAVLAIYATFVAFFLPDYIVDVVPKASAIYWSFDLPFEGIVRPIVLPLLAVVLTGLLSWRSDDKLPLVLSLATIGFALSYLIQQKGYTYHRYPISAAASLAVAALFAGSRSAWKRTAIAGLSAVLLFSPILATMKWWRHSGPGGSFAMSQQQLIDAVNRHAGNGRFLVVAVHPYPAFPTALYVQSRQVSRTNSQWFLPAVMQIRDGRVPPVAGAREVAERGAKDFLVNDLTRNPDLVIVDTDAARHTLGRRDFDILSFYAEDPRFQKLWANYREVESLPRFRLFILKRKIDQ